MTTPTPLTDAEIDLMAFNDDPGDWNDIRFRRSWLDGYQTGGKAIESEVNARWLKMLGEKEPVGEIGWAAGVPNSIREVHWVNGCPPVKTNLFAHPAPDHTALLRQALEALNRVDAVERGMVTTKAHHYAAREETTAAITAIKKALK